MGESGRILLRPEAKVSPAAGFFSREEACDRLGLIELSIDVSTMLGAFSFAVQLHLCPCGIEASGSSPKEDYALSSEIIRKALRV